jgi:metallo-beta-lactamase family protein
VEPLYTKQDAENTMPLFKKVDYWQRTEVSETLSYECYDAGHMLGSPSVLLHERNGGKEVCLAFSGDVGRPGLPIIRDPQLLPGGIDYLIIESTYGGRLHREGAVIKDYLADIVRRTAERGGKLVVPAFAVGRTQQLVLLLNELTLERRIPELPIFVDSPLATNVTEVFRRHPECFDAETTKHLQEEGDPFAFGRLRYTRSVEESKALNNIRYPFVVISASGMCESGRVLHHLRNTIADPRPACRATTCPAAACMSRSSARSCRTVTNPCDATASGDSTASTFRRCSARICSSSWSPDAMPSSSAAGSCPGSLP